jgi:DNA-binding response OmpR family regulator
MSSDVFWTPPQLVQRQQPHARVVCRLARSPEFDVLAYSATNTGKILLHRQVLQAVWSGQYGDEYDYV